MKFLLLGAMVVGAMGATMDCAGYETANPAAKCADLDPVMEAKAGRTGNIVTAGSAAEADPPLAADYKAHCCQTPAVVKEKCSAGNAAACAAAGFVYDDTKAAVDCAGAACDAGDQGTCCKAEPKQKCADGKALACAAAGFVYDDTKAAVDCAGAACAAGDQGTCCKADGGNQAVKQKCSAGKAAACADAGFEYDATKAAADCKAAACAAADQATCCKAVAKATPNYKAKKDEINKIKAKLIKDDGSIDNTVAKDLTDADIEKIVKLGVVKKDLTDAKAAGGTAGKTSGAMMASMGVASLLALVL